LPSPDKFIEGHPLGTACFGRDLLEAMALVKGHLYLLTGNNLTEYRF